MPPAVCSLFKFHDHPNESEPLLKIAKWGDIDGSWLSFPVALPVFAVESGRTFSLLAVGYCRFLTRRQVCGAQMKLGLLSSWRSHVAPNSSTGIWPLFHFGR